MSRPLPPLHSWRRLAPSFLLASSMFGGTAIAQTTAPPAPQTAPAPLTLQDALRQARLNAAQARAAITAADLAAEDRRQARDALLPSLSGFSQYIHTQTNGTPSGVFVANDGPNVYTSWLTVHGEVFNPGKWAEYRSASAAEAVARARADVASRGLVATIVQNYYTLVAAIRKAANASQSLQEAQTFLTITQRQETAGEVAHADVVKAQIQVVQRQRDAQEAELTAVKSRLGLSVLVYPEYRDSIAVTDDLQDVPPLPPLDTIKTAATGYSPDLRAAEASLQQETSGVAVARGEYLPSVSFDYFYGINANQFAIYNPEGNRLLGSSFQAQLTLPMWNWGATQSKLRQAHLRVQQAKAELTLTQRELLASIDTFYREAQVARDQADSLRSSLDLASESLRLTTLRYQAGEVTVLEVVDAQTTLRDARNAYDDGLVRYRVALAALQTLTGTL
jgi:outer membrane protein TolC